MKAFYALAIVLLSGCGLSTANVYPVAGAQSYAPSDKVETLDSPPPSAFELGLIQVQGNNYSNDADCTERVMKEARKLGADSVVFISRKSGAIIGTGPACNAQAYRRAAQ